MSIVQRIDNITRIAPEHFGEEIPAPKSVKIELSGRCNYACAFCALRTRDHQPTQDMNIDLFRRITREMKDAGVEEIGLFYLGESFTNKQLLEAACRYCKLDLKMPYVFLTSNASLADPATVDRLMYAGLDSLKWSVNACDEEQFKEIMGVKPSLFRQALSNIKEAWEVRKKGGYKTGLYASSIRYEDAQLEKMEKLLDEHIRPYVDEHYWLPLYSMAMRAPEIEKRLGYKPMHGNSGRFDPKSGTTTRDGLPCWSVFSEGHVRHDGHLSACCFGSDEKFDVGDLATESFISAWNSPKMKQIRGAHIKAMSEGPKALEGTMCSVCIAYGS